MLLALGVRFGSSIPPFRVDTYRNLEPGPYCPETGQAQTTWIISLEVALVVSKDGGVIGAVLGDRAGIRAHFLEVYLTDDLSACRRVRL